MNAKEFAEFVGTEVQPWMEWEGWAGWVGCDRCAGDGPEAPCWGYVGCHGYENACGCRECSERARKELVEWLRTNWWPAAYPGYDPERGYGAAEAEAGPE